jgi:triacylglycerol lipase
MEVEPQPAEPWLQRAAESSRCSKRCGISAGVLAMPDNQSASPMGSVPYDATKRSLFHPGDADDFFRLVPGQGWSDAVLCAEMSRLAYVKEVARLEAYLGRAGFRKELALGYGNTGTQVFVASNTDQTVRIVAFRGTEPEDAADLFADINAVQTPWNDEADRGIGRVHAGFANALLNDGIASTLKSHLASAGGAPRVLVTGHSLGAALATLMASLTPCDLYTFGSPLVGDASFVQATRQIAHVRYVDCCDGVTLVPPTEFGFVHAGTLRYIDRTGRVLEAPADNVVAPDRAKGSTWYFFRYAFLPGTPFSRALADHAPINYVSGVAGLRVGE